MVTIVKKNSVRLLTKTLAVVSLLAPTGGHSLGIGEIKLHSALNQNLDAEIALTLSGENVSDIKVNLAPPEKFDEAGLSWTYFLSKIKFETISQSNNAAVIKLTSKEALKEPFLDFLLEVNWPKGNLYREFTVLVDPPSVYNQAAIPVSNNSEGYGQAAAARQSHASGSSTGNEYGPTFGNDTLWSIADRVRGQSDVSVEQMMIALYEANPHAFYKENVYALMAGKMLKVPEKEAVLKISRNQALAEFNRHKNTWKAHSAPNHAESAKEKPAMRGGEESSDNQLTLLPPTKTTATDHAEANGPANGEKNSSVATGKIKAKTEGETGQPVPGDGDTSAKLAELEKQLAMMQELISLKDQQLAELQRQLQANSTAQNPNAPAVATPAQPVAQPTPPPPQAEAQPAQQPPAPATPSEIVATKPAVQAPPPRPQPKAAHPIAQQKPKADSLFSIYYLVVGGVGAALLSMLGWLWWRKRKVEEETNTESMFASSNMVKVPEPDENLSVPIVDENIARDAGTVGESSFLSEFTPSDFDSFDTDQGEIDPISEADVYLAYGRYQQAEELIRQAIKDQPNRDECKLKLLEIFYANENKAAFEEYARELASAGRRGDAEFWEKAAEMGREICPDSSLFSVGGDIEDIGDNYAKHDGPTVGASSFENSDIDGFAIQTTQPNNNGLDFDTTFSDSYPSEDEQKNNEDIDFDLSSFSMDSKGDAEQGVIASGPLTAAPSTDEQSEEIEFVSSFFNEEDDDTSDAEDGVIAPNPLVEQPSETKIEFGLRPSPTDAQPDRSSTLNISSLGSDLEEFDFDSTEDSDDISGIDPIAHEDSQKQELDSYELDFSSSDDESGIEDFDFNLTDKNIKNQDDVFEIESLALNDDLGDDFSFDFDLRPTKSGLDTVQFDGLGVSDLTDMDELETKLDLAKAYVDMGDAEAARDIAKEVLEKGTDEQKKTAKSLLDELD